MTKRINRRIVLASRPVGAPTTDNFRLEEVPVPAVGNGQMLLKTLHLSLDPYMRGRMNDAASYVDPVAIDDVMVGGTVSRVVSTSIEGFSPGDMVLSANGWQAYAISDGTGVIPLTAMGDLPPSYALGVLGMPGFTAYIGLVNIGRPQTGETVVVAAAAGAVGSVVGQIAKILGCRVVGIAGSPEKCAYVRDELGFDTCISYKDPDFPKHLARSCPDGIDIYFESVGGAVFNAVLPLLNIGARIPLCGLISQYNATALPAGPDRTPAIMGQFLIKRITVTGFIIFDHESEYPAFLKQMGSWLAKGKVRYREDRIAGLENAPDAFMGMLKGRNFGKLIIDMADH